MSATPVTRALGERLRERRGEIEEAALLRVNAFSALPPFGGPEYAEGLRSAVAIALEFGIEGIERGEGVAVPAQLLAQARLAATCGVSLDVVLRRYVAGHALLGDFVVQEASTLSPEELKRLLRCLAAILDGLLAAVSDAYVEERERLAKSSERRHAERIERLLAGEPLDASGLGYGFDVCHLGLVARGPGAEQTLAGIADSLDARLLAVPREGGVLWAWLGSRRLLDPEQAKQLALAEDAAELMLSIGEPVDGLAGWRLSHRQARAALAVALRGEDLVVRYADVALLASVMQDELLVSFLRRLYLDPLEGERDKGEAARETLRAYFAAEQNVSSTGAALGIDRSTVTKRLRAIEERIGRRLVSCAPELSIALRLGGRPEGNV